MYVKLYTAFWAVVLAAAAIFFVTGQFTPKVAVVFGFIAFGGVFMGMMSVLPSVVHAEHEPKAAHTGPNKLEAVVGSTSNAIRSLGADLAASHSVEMRKPKFP